jgi:hypothetical protein
MMRLSEFFSGEPEMEHLICEWCEGRMWLSTIEPHKAGYDKRTFECAACRNVMTEIVKFK